MDKIKFIEIPQVGFIGFNFEDEEQFEDFWMGVFRI